MNCRGVSRRLSAYIDDNLSPGIREAVEEHLNTCVPCRRQLAEFEAIVNAARNLAPLSISDGFAQRVVALVSSQETARETFGFLRNRLTLAGVGFMVAAMAIFFILGPTSRNLTPYQPVAQEGTAVGFPGVSDFSTHPETKVYSFPVPENTENSQLSSADSILKADSASWIDGLIIPGGQDVRQ